MKISTAIFCAALGFGVLTSSALAKDVVIGVSPYQAPEQLQEQVMQSLKYATGLDAGDSVHVIDAYHIKPLATIEVPEGRAYASPKARLKANKKSVSDLMRFAKQPPQNSPAPSVVGAIRMPQFLRHIGQNYGGGEAVDVLVFGSPLYDDPADSAFSMMAGEILIPGDGHLQVDRSKSVYGIKGNEGALDTIRLHWAYGDQLTMSSDQHAHMIERFWHLFAVSQGAEFVTYTPFVKTVFKRVNETASALPNPHTLQHTERLEMIRLRAVEVKTSIHERPLSSVKPTAQQLRQADKVEVGITWNNCDSCDLDLYVRPTPGSAVIFYNHTRSRYGVLFKDYLNAPSGNGGFETIQLSVPVDLRALAIAINFYGGNSASGVEGAIRLALNGQTYAMPFTISATKGNGGQGVRQTMAGNQSSSPETLLINPLAVLGF